VDEISPYFPFRIWDTVIQVESTGANKQESANGWTDADLPALYSQASAFYGQGSSP
jgi:hypothetical protein